MTFFIKNLHNIIFFSKMVYHIFSTKINPRGASIHRINDLFPLKPPLVTAIKAFSVFTHTSDTYFFFFPFCQIIWSSQKCQSSAHVSYFFWRTLICTPNFVDSNLSIKDWVLCKKGLDGDNPYLKFLFNFRKRKLYISKLHFMQLFSADAKKI